MTTTTSALDTGTIVSPPALAVTPFRQPKTAPIKQALMTLLVILSLFASIASTSSSANAHDSSPYRGTLNVQGTRSYLIFVCLHSDYKAPVCAWTTNGYIQYSVPTGHSYRISASYWLSNGNFLGAYDSWPWFSVTYHGQVVNHRIW